MCNFSFIDKESEPKGLSDFKVPNRNPENSSFPLCQVYFFKKFLNIIPIPFGNW